VFDLQSNDLRPDGWTSADAAGLPILAGWSATTRWPAAKSATPALYGAADAARVYLAGAALCLDADRRGIPADGQRFRLRADFDISGFSPEVQVSSRR